MLIHINEHVVSIQASHTELKSYNRAQLTFFGFTKANLDGAYSRDSQDPGADLQRLIEYLDQEAIPYSLTPQASAVRTSHLEQVEAFSSLKREALAFKNGLVNAGQVDEFSMFVRRHIKRELRSHQLKAAYHLWSIHNGANFSVPGSGKTSVVLTVYEKLRLEHQVNFIFVVGPASSFGPWKHEFVATLGRIPRCAIFAGGEKGSRKSRYYTPPEGIELYLSTFQTVLNDEQELSFFMGQLNAKAFFVVDEAHYIKQLNGAWATAVRNVSRSSVRRCVLTGTPMPRNYSDVFNLFDLLWNEHPPIDSETKIRIMRAEATRDEDTARHALEDAIGPLFYRVRKKDLGLTEPQFHPPTLIQMNKVERMLYDAIETRIRAYSKEDYLKDIDLVNKLRRGRMTRLRQCATYPKLLRSAMECYDEALIDEDSTLRHAIDKYDELERPAKLLHISTFLQKFQDTREKVVIWATFVGAIELISKYLRSLGFSNKTIYGQTPSEHLSSKEEETRETILDEFVDPKSGLDILIANPAACAESISLHKTCHNAIYYDLSYNCAQYLQSLDRIHRVGGSETSVAHYYFLQYENTIDRDIKDNLDQKASRMQKVIDADYSVYSLDMFEEDDTELKAYERLFGK